jgi:VWFA-related protein
MKRWRAPLLAALLALTSVAMSAGQQARFRSGTEAVLVDVQVTANGRPVAGLTAADFEVRDRGVRQDIQVVAFADVPISLLLALDASSSVTTRLDDLKSAARQAIAALRTGDQVSVLAFNDRVALHTGWSRDFAAVSSRLQDVRAHGWTALYDAIFSAVALREQAAGRVVVLLFSDGLDTASILSATQVIEAARRSDVVITAVAAGGRAEPASGREARQAFGLDANLRRWFAADASLFPYHFLDVLTDETGGDLLRISSDDQLASTFRGIVDEFKSRYLLTYTPRGTATEGWHPIDVRLKNRRADVRARRGYWR